MPSTTETRAAKNFARQLARYGREVTVGGRTMLAVWTPVDAAFDLEPGGLAIDGGAATHTISVQAANFEARGDNPEGEQVEDEHGDFWAVRATTWEPGDPELKLHLAPDA